MSEDGSSWRASARRLLVTKIRSLGILFEIAEGGGFAPVAIPSSIFMIRPDSRPRWSWTAGEVTFVAVVGSEPASSSSLLEFGDAGVSA